MRRDLVTLLSVSRWSSIPVTVEMTAWDRGKIVVGGSQNTGRPNKRMRGSVGLTLCNRGHVSTPPLWIEFDRRRLSDGKMKRARTARIATWVSSLSSHNVHNEPNPVRATIQPLIRLFLSNQRAPHRVPTYNLDLHVIRARDRKNLNER